MFFCEELAQFFKQRESQSNYFTFSIISILIDNIIVPGEHHQSGSDEVSASFYDKHGNKFSFQLSLRVTPKEGVDDGLGDTEIVTTEEKISRIEEAIVAIQEDISLLKTYHANVNKDPVVAVNDG